MSFKVILEHTSCFRVLFRFRYAISDAPLVMLCRNGFTLPDLSHLIHKCDFLHDRSVAAIESRKWSQSNLVDKESGTELTFCICFNVRFDACGYFYISPILVVSYSVHIVHRTLASETPAQAPLAPHVEHGGEARRTKITRLAFCSSFL